MRLDMEEQHRETPQNLEPLEKKDRKLVVEWPDREQFLKDRDVYLETYLAKEIRVNSNYVKDLPEDEIVLLSRLSLEAKFVFELMKKISPVRLEIKNNFDNVYNVGRNALTSVARRSEVETDRTLSVDFKLWFKSLIPLIRKAKNYDLVLADTEKLLDGDYPYEEARKIALRQRDLRLEYLDVFIMSSSVQEFAHMLYIQGKDRGSKRKREGWKANVDFQNDSRNARRGATDEYLSLNIEYSGRLWEQEFLRHLFPDSPRLNEVQDEIKRGGEYRKRVKWLSVGTALEGAN